MPKYRVFKQNEMLVIYSAAKMVCATDTAALIAASNVAHDCPAYEVWCGIRRVACVLNDPPGTRPATAISEPPHRAAMQANDATVTSDQVTRSITFATS